jgi:hypothetical protein
MSPYTFSLPIIIRHNIAYLVTLLYCFSYNVLKERISTIENFSYKYQGKVISTIDDCIETQKIEQFKYLIEYEYAEITRDDAYNIA